MVNILAIGAFVFGIILLIIGLIVWAVEQRVEWYTWVLWIVGAVMAIVGAIWWVLQPHGMKGKGKTSDKISQTVSDATGGVVNL